MTRKSGITLIIFLLMLSCNTKKEDQYYENGSVKVEVEVKNGKRHGNSNSYYPDGNLKSRSIWKNGLQDGVTIYYYPNGKVKERSYWKNNKAEGLTVEFYSTGQVKSNAHYHNDKPIGEAIIYSDNGKPLERKIYNNNGELIYVGGYNPDGVLTTSLLMPIFNDSKDTFNLNENYNTIISFGYKLTGNVEMLVGPINKMNDIIDTLAVIRPNKEGKFIYTAKIKEGGDNVLSIKFKHLTQKEDTLSIDGLSTKHVFFVKSQKFITTKPNNN